MSEQLRFAIGAGSTRDRITWERIAGLLGCGRHYRLIVDGEPRNAWVRHCGHPTALRPYYLITSRGEVLETKYRLAADAKAALLEAEDLIPQPKTNGEEI